MVKSLSIIKPPEQNQDRQLNGRGSEQQPALSSKSDANKNLKREEEGINQ
jgi:hypothetical protein